MGEVSTSLYPISARHLLRNSYFHTIRLSAKYRFEKPNDRNALGLMNAAATAVMKELPDIKCAYGISDEYRYYTGS